MNDMAMDCTWLHRRRAKGCVVFFAGWGMDARPFLDMGPGGVDVCMFSNYRKVAPPRLAELSDYDGVILLAWSFGVWMATQVCTWELRAKCTEMVALGGTVTPVDARLGLAPEQFDAVLANFDGNTLTAFYQAMFDDEAHAARFLKNRPRRGLDDLKTELAFLRDASEKAPVALDMFTRHIVTSRDRIFSGRNQVRAWGKDNATSCPWPHFPFYQFATWGDLVAAVTA